MTTPLGATGATSPSASTATARTNGSSTASTGVDLGMGPDAFMKLLAAQMRYQDPMAPTDGQQFMTQMATFTQVEKLAQLVTAQSEVAQWQKRLSAEGMVGKQVTGAPADGVPLTGTVTGVRHTADGPVLQLVDGTSLPLNAVSTVGSPAAAAGAPASDSSVRPSTPSTTSTTGTTGTTAVSA